MPKITNLGNIGIIWILLATVMLYTKKYHKQGLMILCGLAIGVIIGNMILKNLIHRPRPCWLDKNITMLVKIPKDYSFPSGHTLSSAIVATILFLTDKRIGYFSIIIAVLIAFSRMYLFVHFPSDVLAGAVLGIIIGLIVMKIAYKDKKIIS